LAIRYSIESKEPISDFALSGSIEIDGRTVGAIGKPPAANRASFRNEYRRPDARRVEGILSSAYFPFDENRWEHVELGIKLNRVGNAEGDWAFSAGARREQPFKFAYADGETVKDKQGEFDLWGVSFSQASIQVEYEFSKGEAPENRIYGFVVVDDMGRSYGGATMALRSGNEKTTVSFPPLSADAKGIRIKAFYSEPIAFPDKARAIVKEPPTEEKPFVLKVGKDDELVVTGIEYRPDSTIVRIRDKPDNAIGFKLYDVDGGNLPMLDWLWGENPGIAFAPVSRQAKLQIVAEKTFENRFIPGMEIQVNLPSL